MKDNKIKEIYEDFMLNYSYIEVTDLYRTVTDYVNGYLGDVNMLSVESFYQWLLDRKEA